MSANAFDPNSQVHLVVTGPDGTVHDLGMFTTNADGKLVATGVVLPLEVDGIYTVVATGTLDGRAVTLETSYRKVTPETPPVAPPGSQPANPPAPPADKPTALPRTGVEGLALVQAAALISLVAGAFVVRSRRG